jgi:hypothetical protein
MSNVKSGTPCTVNPDRQSGSTAMSAKSISPIADIIPLHPKFCIRFREYWLFRIDYRRSGLRTMRFTTYAGFALILCLLLTVVPVSASSIEAGHPLVIQKLFRHTGNSLSTAGFGLAGNNSSHCNTPDIAFDADADLFYENGAFFYNITGIATEPVQEISIDPRLYRYNDGDAAHAVLLYESDLVVCTDTSGCSAAGNVTLVQDYQNQTGSFFVNGTVLFTPYEDCDAAL